MRKWSFYEKKDRCADQVNFEHNPLHQSPDFLPDGQQAHDGVQMQGYIQASSLLLFFPTSHALDAQR
jgi:hypothetical protein